MTIQLISPTARLPHTGKIKSSSIADIHDAIHYLTLIYNPKVSGSRILDRKTCPLSVGARPPSPCSPRQRLHTLKSQSDADLNTIRADSFERAYAVRWLTALVSQAVFFDQGDEEIDGVVQAAASLLAICAGAASAGTRSRTFAFASSSASGLEDVSVQITDVPLDVHDYSSVGAQTWGGACLLADMITQTPQHFGLPLPGGNPLRILELGAGTGLVGLTAGKVLSSLDISAEIVVTDFQPTVLKNLARNIADNFSSPTSPGSISISSHFLDWSNPPDQSTPPFNQQFDLVYGADIIYEIDHARWIKSCLERFLCKPSPESLVSLSPTSPPSVIQPCFHLVIPLRSTHSVESQTIEEVFPFAPSIRAGWESPANDASAAQSYPLGITAKEIILCEDVVWSNDARHVEYIHYVISWV